MGLEQLKGEPKGFLVPVIAPDDHVDQMIRQTRQHHVARKKFRVLRRAYVTFIIGLVARGIVLLLSTPS